MPNYGAHALHNMVNKYIIEKKLHFCMAWMGHNMVFQGVSCQVNPDWELNFKRKSNLPRSLQVTLQVLSMDCIFLVKCLGRILQELTSSCKHLARNLLLFHLSCKVSFKLQNTTGTISSSCSKNSHLDLLKSFSLTLRIVKSIFFQNAKVLITQKVSSHLNYPAFQGGPRQI